MTDQAKRYLVKRLMHILEGLRIVLLQDTHTDKEWIPRALLAQNQIKNPYIMQNLRKLLIELA